jgi:hypothetical protein
MIVLVLTAGGLTAWAQGGLELDWATVAGGGGTLGGGNYALHGSVGQPAVGRVANAPYTLAGGFQRCAVAHDVSDNGLVDATDVQFTAGRWRDATPGLADRDGDGRATVRDVMLVAAQWGDGC